MDTFELYDSDLVTTDFEKPKSYKFSNKWSILNSKIYQKGFKLALFGGLPVGFWSVTGGLPVKTFL